MCSTGFISPCASTTWRRPPRAGPPARRASARTARGLPMRSSASDGASGTAQVRRALDLVGETLAWLEGMGEATPVAASKATALLRGLETYVSGQAGLIIDYAGARRCGEPISTATTEGTVQWLLHRRMGANQQMRWSPRGAHRMLKVRTAVANGTLADDHAAAERWARRPFRRAA